MFGINGNIWNRLYFGRLFHFTTLLQRTAIMSMWLRIEQIICHTIISYMSLWFYDCNNNTISILRACVKSYIMYSMLWRSLFPDQIKLKMLKRMVSLLFLVLSFHIQIEYTVYVNRSAVDYPYANITIKRMNNEMYLFLYVDSTRCNNLM